MEFGLVIPRGFSSLYKNIPWILEDGENELPDSYRPTLNLLYARLCQLRDDLRIACGWRFQLHKVQLKEI